MSGNASHTKFPRQLEGIIFDVDGTLYDQRRLRFKMLLHLISQCIKTPLTGSQSVRFLRAYRNAHENLRTELEEMDLSARQLEIACEKLGIAVPDGQRIVERFFKIAPLSELRRCIRPGLTNFLLKCRARGLRLGVFSDYEATQKLEAMGLSESFDAVVSSMDQGIGRLKPNPAGLERCMRYLNVHPERVIYVGDRPDVDAVCAIRANVCSVIIHSRYKSDFFTTVSGFEGLSSVLF